MVTSKYVYVNDDHPFAVLVEDESYYRTIRGKAYVAELRDEFAFASDVTERSMGAFASEGIEMPEAPSTSLSTADSAYRLLVSPDRGEYVEGRFWSWSLLWPR